MRILLTISVSLLMFACREKQSLPKPRAFPRVEYPERSYIDYQSATCPFTFQYPSYAELNAKDKDCWFDLFMTSFNARLHCSYIPIKNREEFDNLIRDAFQIGDRINERANYQEEFKVNNKLGVGGLMMEWSGPAASSVHFFLTDTTQHFFKAALYYDSKVRPDSLAPITDFIKEDINHMIATFKWLDK